ncbi:MAG: DUF3365 domain-containing protein [Nitrospirae bacterium]|nr:DUF3365 domain-containing protein [Nitrospirota bacterium]
MNNIFSNIHHMKNNYASLSYMLILTGFWTMLIIGLLAWDIHNIKQGAKSEALILAHAIYDDDIQYRRWNSSHGGVYVPVTDKTPPNPYLSHVPDRDITTTEGIKLTLINPAYMTRQVNELMHEAGVSRRGHITSLNPLRPGNSPDTWESMALREFEKGVREVSSIEEMENGEDFMRMMRPLIVEERCLKCHAAQGYKTGDVRGGISVSVPMSPQLEKADKAVIGMSTGHGIIWFLGLSGLILWWLQQKKLYEELEKNNKELLRINSDYEQLLSVTIHDLRSPLVNIQGYSFELKSSMHELQAVMQHMEMTADMRENAVSIINSAIDEEVRLITSNAHKIDSLHNGIIRFLSLRKHELAMEEIDMDSMISGIKESLKPDIQGAGARLEISELPRCTADRKMMTEIFTHLMGNALKYLQPERPGIIRVSGYREDRHSIYCVEDNGIGIAPEYHQDIFEIFHKLDVTVSGIGLGLTIVRKIVERHNGKVWVESEVGKGSRFYVSLPDINK